MSVVVHIDPAGKAARSELAPAPAFKSASEPAPGPQQPSSTPDLKPRGDIKTLISSIRRKLSVKKPFSELITDLEADMRGLLNAEHITLYKFDRHTQEIVSIFTTSPLEKIIRRPVAPSSIAGYVAHCGQSVCIPDVNDVDARKAIHPKLQFAIGYDRGAKQICEAMVVVPIIKQGERIGVMQFINTPDPAGFCQRDVLNARELALLVADKFASEFRLTKHPFEQLLERELIARQDLAKLAHKAKNRKKAITDLLIDEKEISVDDIGESLERHFQVPFVEHSKDIEVPTDLLGDLTPVYLKKQCWVPIGGDHEEAVILMEDPLDRKRLGEIEHILKTDRLVLRVGLRRDIFKFINRAFNTINGLDRHGLSGVMEDLHREDEDNEALQYEEESNDAEELHNSNIINLVNQVIIESYKAGASDIHLEPGLGRTPANVRIRVDGQCRQLISIPHHHFAEVVARIKVISKMDITERRRPQDGKCEVRINGSPVELRVATLPTVAGESAVLRILASGDALPMEALNLTERNSAAIHKSIKHPHGLFLVVGPTGSGKTTTLHAILGQLNEQDSKIWTAEDPVEITQPRLQQIQVQPAIGFGFADAMRSILRADPDIILIGEMRDSETSSIAVEASLTGHFVLSTLHTNSAPETITRLLDLGLDAMSFSEALVGVLAQRLMRTLCGDCKEGYKPEREELLHLAELYGALEFAELEVKPEELTLYRAKGCPKCDGTGYKGRTGIHEFLQATEAMKAAIYRGAEMHELRELALKEGMRTLFQDGIGKILQGDSDLEQLQKVVAE